MAEKSQGKSTKTATQTDSGGGDAKPCIDDDAAAQVRAQGFGISLSGCEEGKKMGLCSEESAREVCARTCGAC